LEVMAVVAAPLEEVLKTCGFDYALPHQKRAMFVRPQCVDGRLSTSQPFKVTIGEAAIHDLPAVAGFLAPFVARGEVLRRSPKELAHLLHDGFLAKAEGRIVGFVALEIYSEKLAEIQCLSVDDAYRGQGIGRRLIMLSLRRASENHVTETMAISAHEELLTSCGFDFCLPGPKTALFKTP
jgi:amino-acid N-acetyltransferase